MLSGSKDGLKTTESFLGTTHIEKYAATMKEIKLRVEVINLFLSGKLAAHYMPTTVETIGLQFRKVFELIAFASLSANRQRYSSVYTDFVKHWEAAKLLRNLQRINSNFYPKPVIEVPTNDPTAMHALEPRQQDYLTQMELIEAHGRCGKLMHAANPFGKPIDYEFYEKRFSTWIAQIMNLLANHQVHLAGETGFWLFHMHEEGKGNEVSWYRFDPYKAAC
jgi:hypothetical protein